MISYQKTSDQYTTYQLNMPEGATELCTLEGVTYVVLPEGTTLPDEQPEQIVDSIQTVTMTVELREAISNASPHVRLIRQRVADKIAEAYTLTDEIKLLRTTPSAEFEVYNQYVEDCRAWGQEQKAGLGL